MRDTHTWTIYVPLSSWQWKLRGRVNYEEWTLITAGQSRVPAKWGNKAPAKWGNTPYGMSLDGQLQMACNRNKHWSDKEVWQGSELADICQKCHVSVTDVTSHSTLPSLKTLPPSPAQMTLQGSIHTSTSTQNHRGDTPCPECCPSSGWPAISSHLQSWASINTSSQGHYIHSMSSPHHSGILHCLFLQVPHPLPLPPLSPSITLPAVTLMPSQTWCESCQVGHHTIAPAFHLSACPSCPPKVWPVQNFARGFDAPHWHQNLSHCTEALTAAIPDTKMHPQPSEACVCKLKVQLEDVRHTCTICNLENQALHFQAQRRLGMLQENTK